jgi:hypothetical protein
MYVYGCLYVEGIAVRLTVITKMNQWIFNISCTAKGIQKAKYMWVGEHPTLAWQTDTPSPECTAEQGFPAQ